MTFDQSFNIRQPSEIGTQNYLYLQVFVHEQAQIRINGVIISLYKLISVKASLHWSHEKIYFENYLLECHQNLFSGC